MATVTATATGTMPRRASRNWVSRWLETEPVAVSSFRFQVSRFVFLNRAAFGRPFFIPTIHKTIPHPTLPRGYNAHPLAKYARRVGQPGTGQRPVLYVVLPKTCFNNWVVW